MRHKYNPVEDAEYCEGVAVWARRLASREGPSKEYWDRLAERYQKMADKRRLEE